MRVRTVGDLGAMVRQARTDRHLTQAGLADRIGVSRDWIVRLERGHPRLEAQLVLDALEAVGVALVADPAVDTPADTTPLPWDDLFTGLTGRRGAEDDGAGPIEENRHDA